MNQTKYFKYLFENIYKKLYIILDGVKLDGAAAPEIDIIPGAGEEQIIHPMQMMLIITTATSTLSSVYGTTSYTSIKGGVVEEGGGWGGVVGSQRKGAL